MIVFHLFTIITKKQTEFFLFKNKQFNGRKRMDTLRLIFKKNFGINNAVKIFLLL